jgi:hypothetical protein
VGEPEVPAGAVRRAGTFAATAFPSNQSVLTIGQVTQTNDSGVNQFICDIFTPAKAM